MMQICVNREDHSGFFNLLLFVDLNLGLPFVEFYSANEADFFPCRSKRWAARS